MNTVIEFPRNKAARGFEIRKRRVKGPKGFQFNVFLEKTPTKWRASIDRLEPCGFYPGDNRFFAFHQHYRRQYCSTRKEAISRLDRWCREFIGKPVTELAN